MKRKMRNMKCRTPKLLVSFFILAIILIIAVPSTGFAAKTTVSTVKAVSYTHLDVYKRQVVQSALRETLIFMEKVDSDRQANLTFVIMDWKKGRMHLSFCAKS